MGTDTIDQIAKPEIVPVAQGYRFDQAPTRPAGAGYAASHIGRGHAKPSHHEAAPGDPRLALRHVPRFNARMPDLTRRRYPERPLVTALGAVHHHGASPTKG
jgi:hypothetical protein